MSSDLWVRYLGDLAEIDNIEFVAIALDVSAFNFPETGLGGLNFIRAFEYHGKHFQPNLRIAIFHEVYRYGLNQSRERLKLGKGASLKLFLSHTKDSVRGLAVARDLKALIDSSQMRDFFDATDIAVGYDFESEILNHISDSTLVCIHSDSYSSRYWCQREVLAAKDKERPIVAVDLIGEFEDRRFPLAANIPAVRLATKGDDKIKGGDLLAILEAALLESIRFFYAGQVLSAYQAAGWFPDTAILSSRPPEAYVIAKAYKDSRIHPSESAFVYPDPPIYPEEAAYFEHLGLRTYTPLTSSRVDLTSRTIGISVSDTTEASLLDVGQTHLHLQLLAQEIARYTLSNGAELVYGGDLRNDGFTKFLFAEAHALQSRLRSPAIHLTNHVAWPIHLKENEKMRSWKARHRRVATIVDHPLPKSVSSSPADAIEFSGLPEDVQSFIWSCSLTEMRQSLTRDCDVRIAAGGKVLGYSGRIPGIMEEVGLALSAKQPVFLIGGFGGVTRDLCGLVSTGVIVEELTFDWHLKNSPKFKAMIEYAVSEGQDYQSLHRELLATIAKAPLNNGLSDDDNSRLFETPFVDEVIHLLLKGLDAISLTSN